MLVLSKFTLFFMMISLLILYLFTNIKLIGEGSPALAVLGFSVMIGIFMIVLEIILKKKCLYQKIIFIFNTIFYLFYCEYYT